MRGIIILSFMSSSIGIKAESGTEEYTMRHYIGMDDFAMQYKRGGKEKEERSLVVWQRLQGNAKVT